jgi:hypothetical protein
MDEVFGPDNFVRFWYFLENHTLQKAWKTLKKANRRLCKTLVQHLGYIRRFEKIFHVQEITNMVGRYNNRYLLLLDKIYVVQTYIQKLLNAASS